MKMTPAVEARLRQLESQTQPAEVVREQVREYMAKAQLSQPQFAQRVGYVSSAIKAFLGDRYIGERSATDVRLRVAMTDFMTAFPIEVVAEAGGRLYETENVKIMRKLFDACLRDRSMAYCYGAPGSQKTWVFTHLVADHNRREAPKNGHGSRAFIVYCSQNIAPRDLLRRMCRAAVIPAGNTVQDAFQSLRWELRTRRSLFVLDEAQHLPVATLEIARELNDCEPHCGILLAGSHKLAALFRERAAELEQWNSRLAAGVELPGMTEPEAIAIVATELGKLPIEDVKSILDASRVADAYHQGVRAKGHKVHTYISARRLFHQLARIGSDPMFTRDPPAAEPVPPSQGASL